ncbi:MAG: flagellar motor protein MotB [Proteobacteria bacterium]|nr:flagellar motor protein MotB [Pseudomonadota bacterium]
MARKEPEEKPEWELSNIALMMFTSLMIILLAFFIMLNSMAVVDEKRQISALGSVLGAFGLLPGGLSPTQEEAAKSVAPPTGPMEPVKTDLQLIRDVLSNRVVSESFNILRGRSREIISLQDAVLFPPDGVDILPEAEPVLMDIAHILQGSDYPITIEGHTDDRPPRTEGFKDNWHVSAMRAVAILRFFTEKGGLDPNRMTAFGYAGFSPIAPNNSPLNRAKNRRIDLVLDNSHRLRVLKHEERFRRDRRFEFRGFSFKLFGKDGE